MHVLVLCTANICRSPMAERLLAHHAEVRDIDVSITSAGFLTEGRPAADESQRALAALGLDIGEHRSRRVDLAMVDGADLVVAMEARHVREATVLAPERFDAIYTIRELVERGASAGPRGGLPLAEWLEVLSRDRDPSDLVGRTDLDVADPFRGPMSGYTRTADELVTLTSELADLLWGPPPPGARSLPIGSHADAAQRRRWWTRSR